MDHPRARQYDRDHGAELLRPCAQPTPGRTSCANIVLRCRTFCHQPKTTFEGRSRNWELSCDIPIEQGALRPRQISPYAIFQPAYLRFQVFKKTTVHGTEVG